MINMLFKLVKFDPSIICWLR